MNRFKMHEQKPPINWSPIRVDQRWYHKKRSKVSILIKSMTMEGKWFVKWTGVDSANDKSPLSTQDIIDNFHMKLEKNPTPQVNHNDDEEDDGWLDD